MAVLFFNAQQARIIRLTLYEMGHPQLRTPIHIDNNTCVEIVNTSSTHKRSKSRAMHGQYFWLLDCDAQKEFSFRQYPGQENLGNYPFKAHAGTIHKHVRPYYVHMETLPSTLT